MYERRSTMNMVAVTVLVILDQILASHVYQSHPAPENQNLDPNDHSPGTLVLPKNYKRYMAPLPRKIKPGDLSDDEINVHNYYYRNNPNYFLWNRPPCEWYHEKHDSVKNQGRRQGCRNIRYRLLKDQRKEAKNHQPPSVNCSKVVGSACFQFRGHRGRCYMRVKTSENPAPKTYKYVLINYCD